MEIFLISFLCCCLSSFRLWQISWVNAACVSKSVFCSLFSLASWPILYFLLPKITINCWFFCLPGHLTRQSTYSQIYALHSDLAIPQKIMQLQKFSSIWSVLFSLGPWTYNPYCFQQKCFLSSIMFSWFGCKVCLPQALLSFLEAKLL